MVTAEQFDRTMDYCLRFLEQHCGMSLWSSVKPVAEDWHSLHQSRVGVKKPDDLSVLFLAGPDPTEDLRAFKKAGVPLTNIWAIEGDRQAFNKAVGNLGREGVPLKVHHGSLQKFFSVVPQQFDIIYFDSCGPLFGGDPPTISVVRELFVNQRLAPLSVLITNFAEPCPNLDPAIVTKRLAANIVQRFPQFAPGSEQTVGRPASEPTPAEKNLVKWGGLVGLWSYANGDNDTWTQNLDEFVESEVLPGLLRHYSQFTTEFVIRFAGQLLPWWRVVALPGSRREYFADDKALANAAKEAEKVVEALSHPLYAALRHVLFTEGFLDPSSSLHAFYFRDALEQAKLGDAVKAVSLIRTFLESEWGDTFFSTQHIRDACSPALVKVLEKFRWFDHGKRVFCYDPLPHLLTDLLTGLYGYPYHANTRKLDRIAYKAKETVMFTDVFVFDQARYLYDLLPTLPFFDDPFPMPQQLVLRVCMDAIRRHAHFGCPDLFQGSDLAASGEDGFTYWQPPKRACIGCSEIDDEEPPTSSQ